MKPISRFLSACYRDTDPAHRRSIAAMLGLFLVCTLALCVPSCAHTEPGLDREQAMYRAGTNIVGTAQTIVPYLPAPAGMAAEVVLGIASGLLAAWNTRQHLEIKKLKNGNGNGHAKELAKATASPGTGP